MPAALRHGPMYQRAVDAGQLKSDTGPRLRILKLLDQIPEGNRNLPEERLRGLMHEASHSGAKKVVYLGDGQRASVFTKLTSRFPPHYRDLLSNTKLSQVEAMMAERGFGDFISACVRTGNNSAGHQANFEIVTPREHADLLLTGGICFFPMPEGEHADGFMLILPDSKERTVNISKADCTAIIEDTDYPGNAGKKTLMTIAGWMASQAGLIMEHFGLGIAHLHISDDKGGRFVTYNIKVGGASFTGKTATLVGFVDPRVLRPGEFRICFTDDMIFTDPKTGMSFSMENGNFFTCTDRDPYFMKAQADPHTIGYNITVTNGEFDWTHRETDPNARIAVARGSHLAIDAERFNTTDTEGSSGRLDVSMQLFRGPHFPPGFIMDPDIAAVLLAAGPTQKTAAQLGGSSVKIKGCSTFDPILDEAEFEAKKAAGQLTALQLLIPPALAKELLEKRANHPVEAVQLINDLFVSGFIMEEPASYMNKLLGFYTESGASLMHLGLNTGYSGPIVADLLTHPWDPPRVTIHDFSAQLPPLISQDLWVHALRGEIKTEYDPALGVHVITKAGNIDYTQLLPRTRYKKAGIDYDEAVAKACSRYADFLEKNGLGGHAKMLRSPPNSRQRKQFTPAQAVRTVAAAAPAPAAPVVSSFAAKSPATAPAMDPIAELLISIGRVTSSDPIAQSQEIAALAKELEQGHLIVDLSQVDFINSTSIGELIGLYKQAEAAGRFFAVFGPQERVRNVFSQTKMELVFQIFDSEAAANAAAENFEFARLKLARG